MSKLCLLPTLVLAACVAADSDGPSPAAADELARALEGRVAGEPVACVRLTELGGNRSAGDAIIFDGRGSRVYVNRPAGGCPDLDFGRALRTRPATGQLCRGDIVTVFDPATGTEYGGCGLGEFVPYDRAG